MIPVLTTTGHVLVAIALCPDSRVRDIATSIGVTERTVIISISQLVEAGVVSVEKSGRRNLYKVNHEHKVHVGPASLKICDLVDLVAHSSTGSRSDDDRD